ncbi:YraN family protein [Luteococcus sp. Sow4_B9]|uniref:YraN family protein n=1 Tax=Luteococcus sp. Sow4_B9 TaxID=3438792 RepID=UPI003F97A09A
MDDGRAPTSSHDQRMGRLGEDLADAHLRGLGWQVIDRNWRCAHGEIDIVAREPSGPKRTTLVFVEVKYRSGTGFGDPLEAITAVKVKRLTDLSQLWVRERRAMGRRIDASAIRIDAVGILRVPGGNHRITHVRGITR